MIRELSRPLRLASRRGINAVINRVYPPVVVLIYHRVCQLKADPQLLTVSPDNFRAQLRLIKDSYPILRFDEPWFPRDKPAVVITFDDGYADNYLQALPILEEEGVPATFFVSTATIGTQEEFWWDELERLLLVDRVYPAEYGWLVNGQIQRWATDTYNGRIALYSAMHPALKEQGMPERQAEIKTLRDWLGVDAVGRESHRALSVNELQRLSNSELVDIGAHTKNHPQLASLSAVLQREEILSSQKVLQHWLGRDIKTFSYPFGRKVDYNSASVQLCTDLGFTKVASNYAGQARPWHGRFEIPRCLVRNWSEAEFEQWLEQAFIQ